MKISLRAISRLIVLLFFLGLGQTLVAQSFWRFTALVGVEKQTADYYEKQYAKPIATIVREQMATVNAHFNSTDKFKGTYDFRVDSVYVISGTVQNDLFKPHPGFDYKVVIDGFAASTAGGGWYGSSRLIYHKWLWSDFGGPFQEYATDGLTHEFGHARGATDIYAMKVDANKNPINGKAFDAISSIMNYPYGNITWDEHTVSLLNRTGADEIIGEDYIISAFPKKIAIRVRDQWGNLQKNAQVALYPVRWYSYTVSPQAIQNVVTDERGEAVLPFNPFSPGDVTTPWHIRYSNFLVKASFNVDNGYEWMPLYEVQNAYFKNGADSTYYLNITLPATPAALSLNFVNKTDFCSGDSLFTYTKREGTFGAANVFSLQLSDSAGSFQNPYTIGTLKSSGYNDVIGVIPNIPTGYYKVRMVSSEPVVQSNTISVRIHSASPAPTVANLEVCQNAAAPLLNATGQFLRWYTSALGGLGTSVAPVVSTANAGESTFYVSQTVGICESSRAAIRVTVQPLPTMSISGSTSIYIGEDTHINLSFTGQPPYRYRLSNGLTGTATKDTVIRVIPQKTTVYQVEEVQNPCGTGQAGSASAVTVSVLTPTLETLAFTPASFCPGSTLKIGYKANGRIVPGTSFKLQLARAGNDTTFVDLLGNSVANGEITGVLPDSIASGTYKIRVMAIYPTFVLAGSPSSTTLTVLSGPTASLSGEQTIFAGDTAQLSIAFTGEAPWTFSYQAVNDNSAGTPFTGTTSSNPYTLRVNPLKTTVYYLTAVSNACGGGTFGTDSTTIKVVPLLSASDPALDLLVEVYPVPTTSELTVRIRQYASQKATNWELYDLLGQRIMRQYAIGEESALSLENQPAGLYLLKIFVGEKVVVRRVLKQ